LGSPAITAEIRKTPDEKRRKEMLLLTEQIGDKAIVTPDVAKRVRELEVPVMNPLDWLLEVMK
jgi:hypothetical protein